jgi:hypothetical protein
LLLKLIYYRFSIAETVKLDLVSLEGRISIK